MAETNYSKYIIFDDSGRPTRDVRAQEKYNKVMPTIAVPVNYLDDTLLPGAFYADCMWYHTPSDVPVEPHTHDFDEILGFYGSNPADYHDLCGEIEFWLGDEKYIINKSCTIFIPKGLKHCPLIFHRVDRPIFHISAGPAKVYDKKQK